MSTTNVTIRMDKELKMQADELFAALGLNMSTAMGVFCRQAVRLGKIPFELAVDEENENVHTRLNHPSILGQAQDEGKTVYTDGGETKAYSSFAARIEVQEDKDCPANERFANNAFKEYNNRLIYDIENALLNNKWTTDLKKYLGIIQGE